MTITRHTALIVSLFFFPLALATHAVHAAQMPNYIFPKPTLHTTEQDALYGLYSGAYERGDYFEADTSMVALLDMAANDPLINHETEAKLRSNAAVLQAQLLFATDDIDHASIALDQVAQATELVSAEDPFHPMLSRILLVKSLIHEILEDYSAAIESLRHAQHLIHRQHGVYTDQQLPIVDRIAMVSYQQGDEQAADREYLFELMIGERAFGANSPEQISMLIRVGNHFALRAATQPSMQSMAFNNLTPSEYRQLRPTLFRTAFEMYENAIAIIESTYGPDDLRLVQPLKEMAFARILQGTGQRHAKKALERVVDIVAANPGTDAPDHAKALVELADIYTITGDPAAGENYLRAWHLLETDPNYHDLQTKLFTTNRRLYPLSGPANRLPKQPLSVAQDDELYIDLGYSIRANGRTQKVKIVDSNLPNAYKRDLQNWYQRARFRPRIEQGALVRTDGLELHQVYEVVAPLPTESEGFKMNTDPADPSQVPVRIIN